LLFEDGISEAREWIYKATTQEATFFARGLERDGSRLKASKELDLSEVVVV
jgi:hypothetical protein